MKTYNCPQCGSELPIHFKHSKLSVCSHCGSTILLEDKALRSVGQAAALADLPSLIQMHIPFTYESQHQAYGRIVLAFIGKGYVHLNQAG